MSLSLLNEDVVLVLDDQSIEGLEYNKEGKGLIINDDLFILPTSKSKDFENEFVIMGETRIRNKMLLIRSPFDDGAFVEIEQARNQIALQKSGVIIRFCKLLGAKTIDVTDIRIEDQEKNIDASIAGGAKGVKGDLKSAYQEVMGLKSQMELKAVNTGGKPALERAKKLLKENRLNTDPVLLNLYHMIEDSEYSENKTIELTKEFSLTSSLNKSFELAGALNFPGGVGGFGLKTDSKQKLETFYSLKITF